MTTTARTSTTTMTTLAPPTHELERQLRTLSLSGMAQTLLARNQEAISHHLAYTEFLELLVSDEFARRRDRLFTRRLKAARVPQLKTLESFDWSFNPHIPKALILDLGTVRFIPEHGGLLLLGPPGTGKSHIALSLTVAAIQAGYTAYYRSAFDLAQDLAEADATGTRPELIKKLTRIDLLVIEAAGRPVTPGFFGGIGHMGLEEIGDQFIEDHSADQHRVRSNVAAGDHALANSGPGDG